jgi:glycosyltransferase involved in cell wall biosynthesis
VSAPGGRVRAPLSAPAGRPDVLVVVIDSTPGWTAAARELSGALRDAGAVVELAGTGPVPRVRTFALTDLVQARMARAVASRALERLRPRSVIYCSIVSALLWPAPGAIWLDALTAENRPGRHGVWQRSVERRRLRQAPLVMTMSERSLDPLGAERPDGVVVPSPISPPEHEPPPLRQRPAAALTYAGNPEKKRLAFVLEQWQQARREGETLIVAGLESIPESPGVRSVGRVGADEYRALLRGVRAFVCAPVREDYGIAPLEALAEGCQLVSTPAPGPYPALDLARALDPRLVCEQLVAPLRAALDEPRSDYAPRARALLEPFTPAAVRKTLTARVLPRLVTGW